MMLLSTLPLPLLGFPIPSYFVDMQKGKSSDLISIYKVMRYMPILVDTVGPRGPGHVCTCVCIVRVSTGSAMMMLPGQD